MTLFGDDAVAMGVVESPDVNRGTILAASPLHVYLSNHDILASNSLKLTSLCPPIQHCSLLPLAMICKLVMRH